MMALAADKLRHLGAGVDSIDLGSQQVPGAPSSSGDAMAMPCLPKVVSREGLTQTLSPVSTESRFPTE